jgi:iron complex transport system ATP-binding protein
MESVLSVDRVAFQYGETPVLREVSLELSAGCFMGLIGPNGSGKTTLLRIAAGLLKPSKGVVRLGEKPMERLSRVQVARQLALLPQSPNLPATFTAWELVLMGRTPFIGFLGHESSKDVAAAERAMGLAQCEQLADRRMEELSGGEQQRVLMARALAQEPTILLLDEPTAHLDMRHQIAVIDLVAELVEGGMAALGVFHDLNLAASYCHRLAVLSQGRLVADGTPGEVLRADTLSEVFHVDLCLTPHPRGGVPAVLPPGPRRGAPASITAARKGR